MAAARRCRSGSAHGDADASEVADNLQDCAGRLGKAAALGTWTPYIRTDIAPDAPSPRNVVADRALRQHRAIVEIDDGEGAESEVLDEGVRPGDVRESLMSRRRLLLIVGEAAKVPKLARSGGTAGADLEPLAPIRAREAALVIVIFEIDDDLALALRP